MYIKECEQISNFVNNVHVIVLVLPHSTVIVRVLCVFTNYKIIENIDFCSWRT
jgi:hypothetical protein